MSQSFLMGWAETDITPLGPALLAGQFHARVSEGVSDPLTATVWALQSDDTQAIWVSCDLIAISDELREALRTRLSEQTDEIDPKKVVLHATHTHSGPLNSPSRNGNSGIAGMYGVELPAGSVEDYIAFAAKQLAAAIMQAWRSRVEGGIAFGIGLAVIARNRRWVDYDGKAHKRAAGAAICHIEGYEDHSVNVLATYDVADRLTGLIINVPCPSQLSESAFAISADWWCETRQELRSRFGKNIFILPQCSAAGDMSARPHYEQTAHARMLELTRRTPCQEVAQRIARAVEDILPYIGQTIDRAPVLKHAQAIVSLPMLQITEEEALAARSKAQSCYAAYEAEIRKLTEQPELRSKSHWYKAATGYFNRHNWEMNVVNRFERQQTALPVEVHVLRIGQVAFATNPFELYLDFGVQMKVRSPAVQTFVVQLAGPGTYLPSQRALDGGDYGAIPASCPVGPEGGRELVEHTVRTLQALWGDE